MKTKHILLVMVAVLFVTLTGCKKYPDGPTISLSPKKWRLDGTWKIEQVLENGQDVTSAYTTFIPNYTLQLKSDKTYTETYTGSSSADVGTWSWNDSKKYLLMTPSGSSTANNLKILKLKHNALWLQETDGSDVTETHYVRS
jgi:hypothetical protein